MRSIPLLLTSLLAVGGCSYKPAPVPERAFLEQTVSLRVAVPDEHRSVEAIERLAEAGARGGSDIVFRLLVGERSAAFEGLVAGLRRRGHDARLVIVPELAPTELRLTAERSVAVPASCFARGIGLGGGDLGNGCVQDRNLAAMVADRNDLVSGRNAGESEVRPLLDSVEGYIGSSDNSAESFSEGDMR